MPFDIGKISECVGLGQRLLHVILAERALPEHVGGADALGALTLADGQQTDRFRVAFRRGRRPSDSRPDGLPRLLV